MRTVEERVAFVEARAGEQGHMIQGIREGLNGLSIRVDRLDTRIDHLETRMDRRFESIEQRLTALDQKLDLRTDALDQKISRHFTWLVGLQVTTMIAIVTALAAG